MLELLPAPPPTRELAARTHDGACERRLPCTLRRDSSGVRLATESLYAVVLPADVMSAVRFGSGPQHRCSIYSYGCLVDIPTNTRQHVNEKSSSCSGRPAAAAEHTSLRTSAKPMKRRGDEGGAVRGPTRTPPPRTSRLVNVRRQRQSRALSTRAMPSKDTVTKVEPAGAPQAHAVTVAVVRVQRQLQ